MKEKGERSEERMNSICRTASERRKSIILHRELLKYDRRDRRSGVDRRRGIDERAKPVYSLA